MIKRVGLRLLTPSEIRLAKELYGYSIQYHRVWTHHGSYFPFGVQSDNTAVTPNGEIWFQTKLYRDNYAIASADYQHLLMHIWQYQHGMNFRTRGLISWAVNYKYTLDRGNLSCYSMEQQASLVSDYWLLMKFGLVKKE